MAAPAPQSLSVMKARRRNEFLESTLHEASLTRQQLEREKEQLYARAEGAFLQMQRETNEKQRLEEQLR